MELPIDHGAVIWKMVYYLQQSLLDVAKDEKSVQRIQVVCHSYRLPNHYDERKVLD